MNLVLAGVVKTAMLARAQLPIGLFICFFILSSSSRAANICLSLIAKNKSHENHIDGAWHWEKDGVDAAAVIFRGRNYFPHTVKVDLSAPIPETQKNFLTTNEIKAKTLGAEFMKRAEARNFSVDTVVYPCAGFDSPTPFLVFPTAKQVVALDNHPFIINDKTLLTTDAAIKQDVGSFSQQDELNKAKYMGAVILTRLSAAFPGFRLRSIYAIEETSMETGYHTLSHGVIEFDTGDGTLMRRYVHLQAPFNPATLVSFDWWLASFRTLPFQAVLRKAAMTFFHPENTPGMDLLDILRQNHGAFVDADQIKTDSFPKSPDQILFTNWGYSSTVGFTFF